MPPMLGSRLFEVQSVSTAVPLLEEHVAAYPNDTVARSMLAIAWANPAERCLGTPSISAFVTVTPSSMTSGFKSNIKESSMKIRTTTMSNRHIL
jgi:hypothetical protein